MKLNARLKAIADMVPADSRVADIGTDHGYLPAYLVETGKAKWAVAADVSRGSLDKAVELIAAHGLQGRIETRLGDGLGVLIPGEADIIVIAGMGGVLIRDILEGGADVLEKVMMLVLQPMNAQEVVREWLGKNGFIIEDENLVKDKGKIYQVIAAVHGEQHEDDPFYFEIGRKLVEKGDPLLCELAVRKIGELTDIVESLKGCETEDGRLKLGECLERIRRYREVVEACR